MIKNKKTGNRKKNDVQTTKIQSPNSINKDKNKVSTKDIIKMMIQHSSDKHRQIKQYEVRDFLDSLAVCITSSLQSEKSVFLPKIGVFEIQQNKATCRRNPQNKQLIQIPDRKSVKCRVFKSFSKKALSTTNEL